MPDLSPTRLLLENGVRENRWAGYTLAAFSADHPFSLHGGCVTQPTDSVPWYSAGKPITAIGVLQLLAREPHLADLPMKSTFPELTSSYFGDRTLTDILTHRTGIRFPDLPILSDEKDIFAILSRSHPRDFALQPGQAAYDPRGGWWLLGQWLSRHTQQPWATFLLKNVLQPSGAPNMFFATPSQHPSISMLEKKGEVWTPAPESYGTGGGLCGSATELAQLYRCLLSGGTSSSTGSAVLDTHSLQKFTHRCREGEFDSTFRHIVDFGLGVIVDSNRYGPTTIPYGFGTHSSQTAYGHGGARSSIAFADPQQKIAVALCLIGLAPENLHQPRMRTILDQLRSDLA